MEPDYTVLWVDDPRTPATVADRLERSAPDIEVLRAASTDAGLDRLEEERVNCVVGDARSSDAGALAFLEAVRETRPELPFVVLLGEGAGAAAAEAVRAGATEYVAAGADRADLVANRIRNAVDGKRSRVAYRDLFDAVDDAVLILDVDAGTVVDANATARDRWGLDRSEASGLAIDALGISVPAADGSSGTEWLRTRNADESATVDWYCDPPDRDPFWVEARVRRTTLCRRTLVLARDVTDRRHRERATDALLSTARDLMTMTDREAVCETAVETVAELFDADASRAALVDDEFATDPSPARPVAATDAARAAVPDDELEAAVVVDDIVAAEANDRRFGRRIGDEAAGSLSIELELPLGHHGVLYVGSTERRAFAQHERDLARIFAAHVGAALDRADRDRLLRKRERELADKRDELAALNHVNEVIRDVNRALVHVSTRDEIERLVCERFAAADRYRYAWIGRYDAESGRVTSVTRAGIGGGDGLAEAVAAGADAGDDQFARAIADRDVAIVPEMSRRSIPEERVERARANGYHSVAYVPVTYQNILYDVLVVYAGTRDAFGPDERAVLAELGETIGYAINAAQRRSTRSGGDVVELTFSIEDDRSAVVSLSAAVDYDVELASWSLQSSGPSYLFVRVRDADAAAVESWADADPSVAEVVELDDSGDDAVFKIGVRDAPLVEYFADEQRRLAATTAANGRGTVVAEIHDEASVRRFVDLFEGEFDGARLLSRELRRDRSSRGSPWARIADRLTDRQHEVLQVAFYGGFFDRPRRKNGADLADLLGITQPTFHQHLRVGQRELLAGVLEERRGTE